MAAKKMTEQKLRKALVQQLKEKNIMTDYNLAEVEEYIRYWKANELLFKDIEERGVKVTYLTTKGTETTKTNESISDAQKNSATMLKIMQALGLQDPVIKGSNSDYL